MSTTLLAAEDERSRLERRANTTRTRLLRTLDALDTRRHQIVEMGHHVKRLAVPVVVSLVGVAAVVAGSTLAIRALVERRRERKFGYRLTRALARRGEPRLPFWHEALRKVTLTALGMIAREVVKRGAHAIVNQARPRQLPPPDPLPYLSPASEAQTALLDE